MPKRVREEIAMINSIQLQKKTLNKQWSERRQKSGNARSWRRGKGDTKPLASWSATSRTRSLSSST